MKKSLIVLLSIALAFSICGCTAEQTVSTQIPAQTESMIEAPAQTESPIPTATETPAPTETVDKEAAAKVELDQRIQDFLNKDGDYTTMDVASQCFLPKPSASINTGDVELGLLDSAMDIQGVLLFTYKLNRSLVLIMGFDGINGNRFITPIELPIYACGFSDRLTFCWVDFENNQMTEYSRVVHFTNDQQEIIDDISLRVGEVIGIYINTESWTEDFFKKQKGGLHDFIAEFFKRNKYSSKLVEEIAQNGLETLSKLDSEGCSILHIENSADLTKVIVSETVMAQPQIIIRQ